MTSEDGKRIEFNKNTPNYVGDNNSGNDAPSESRQKQKGVPLRMTSMRDLKYFIKTPEDKALLQEAQRKTTWVSLCYLPFIMGIPAFFNASSSSYHPTFLMGSLLKFRPWTRGHPIPILSYLVSFMFFFALQSSLLTWSVATKFAPVDSKAGHEVRRFLKEKDPYSYNRLVPEEFKKEQFV